jgi:lipid-binding SYLF domain-containing protein|tara:strand:- start:225 stop:809 length:585 start_codon:yes stop_codon:yes gene_type:complete
MMRKLLLLLLITFQPFSFADNYDGTLDVFESSPDLQSYFDNAYGYAVFPTVGRGGMVIGGSYGNGQVYENGRVAGRVSLTKLSIGFQLGGQVFSEIIFLQDKRAFDEFISNRFEFDASASAVAIVLGAQAQAGTAGSSASAGVGPVSTNQVEYGYNKGMAVFLHTLGGLMYEASIGGQKFKYTPLERDVKTPGL